METIYLQSVVRTIFKNSELLSLQDFVICYMLDLAVKMQILV